MPGVPESFHPAVKRWFSKYLGEPTPIQLAAWQALSGHQNAVISAPTGEGKTLAAFLGVIDRLVKRAEAGENIRCARVLYISPLKALSNDIEKNLQAPLQGIRHELAAAGVDIDEIHAMVRTGDTSAAERARLIRLKPQIVVTTPESLYLMLTSTSGRTLLETIETVIIDEVHALASTRRGAHLSLSLARLECLCADASHQGRRSGEPRPLQRIAVSATVQPLAQVARYLAGDAPVTICRDDRPRAFDIHMLLPPQGLSAVMSGDAWSSIYAALAQEIAKHRTTLIFVNNRRLCERLARHLSDLIGRELVASHHGSLSHAQRHKSEQQLKTGALKVMVATSSLELGLDIGSIDLVVQVSSPRSIHAFIQRAGRSEHHKNGTSRALLVPLTRDDLSECVALVRAVRQGRLEQLSLAAPALDILAQHIVAEVAMRDILAEDLYVIMRSEQIWRDLPRSDFDEVLAMLNDGYSLRFGRRSRYIFYDRTEQRVRARPGARITAVLNGGAIPENFEYEVVDERENAYVGSVHEDFAIESSRGDVFQLGNRLWQITKVSGNRVSVFHAPDKHPTIPFWIVDVPGRTDALSSSVSSLHELYVALGDAQRFGDQVCSETGLPVECVLPLADYYREAVESLGGLPTQSKIILERFFDEVKNCHIVLHAPFGAQINRAWGLALRKRFCRQFNFELQAAANDNAIILSLSHTHSFVLSDVFQYLKSASAQDVLTQALLDAPMFEVRWRWNASRALAILRRNMRGKVPAQWQKSGAQDLVALLFPDQIACAENLQGARSIPDHPLVKQTVADCLNEAMDAQGFLNVLRGIEVGVIETRTKDSAAPSMLAHEIIGARPYAFLDDAPLEERRTRAVYTDVTGSTLPRTASSGRPVRTGVEARAGDEISDATIAAVRAETLYPARNEQELYDLFTQFAVVPVDEIASLGYAAGVEPLVARGKVLLQALGKDAALENREVQFYVSADRAEMVQSVYSALVSTPAAIREKATQALILAHLELLGPYNLQQLAQRLELPDSRIEAAILALENQGAVFQLQRGGTTYFTERSFYQRLQHYGRRRSVQKRVSPAEYLMFLHHWQSVAEPMTGPLALLKVLRQLQGVALSHEEWTRALTLRICDFSERMLEDALLSGEFFWWRPALAGAAARGVTARTRYMLLSRELWQVLAPSAPTNLDMSADARRVHEYLGQFGASFLQDIHLGNIPDNVLILATNTSPKLFTEQTLRGLRELIAQGLVTSDQFYSLRRLTPRAAKRTRFAPRLIQPQFPSGRFSLVRFRVGEADEDTKLRAIAELLLARHGVVYRYAAENDFFKAPWPKLVRTLRLMEMAGQVRSGRFIDDLWGEQFAEPAAIGALGQTVSTSYKEETAHDPIGQVRAALIKIGALPSGPPRKALTA